MDVKNKDIDSINEELSELYDSNDSSNNTKKSETKSSNKRKVAPLHINFNEDDEDKDLSVVYNSDKYTYDSDEDYKFHSEELDDQQSAWVLEDLVNLICSITDYPGDLVRDVLLTARLLEVEEVTDFVYEQDTIPSDAFLRIPLHGVLRISPIFHGRDKDNVNFSYTFTPTVKFNKLVQNAFYHGKTPMLSLYKWNFNRVIKWRYKNIIHDDDYKGGDDTDE